MIHPSISLRNDLFFSLNSTHYRNSLLTKANCHSIVTVTFGRPALAHLNIMQYFKSLNQKQPFVTKLDLSILTCLLLLCYKKVVIFCSR